MSDIPRPDPSGPENIPIRDYVKSLAVVVFIYNLKKNDEIIDMRQIDFSNKEDKGWLARMSVWAWTNGYSVETMSLKDAEGRS